MQSETPSTLEQQVQQVVYRLDKLDTDINGLKADVNGLKIAWLEANTKIEAYQRASNQVVNLSFALITAATVSILVSLVLGR